jgi:putative phosphoesterase
LQAEGYCFDFTMKSIGLLSDTHGYLDERVFDHFANCDEVWHAGDIGSTTIIDQLEAFKPTRIVFGNIDNNAIRARSRWKTSILNWKGFASGSRTLVGHLPATTRRYMPELKSQTPDIFICGHSHILRVIRDKSLNNMLYINPGAAGREGFHKFRTLLRFNLHEGLISQMEVIELGKRGAII